MNTSRLDAKKKQREQKAAMAQEYSAAELKKQALEAEKKVGGQLSSDICLMYMVEFEGVSCA